MERELTACGDVVGRRPRSIGRGTAAIRVAGFALAVAAGSLLVRHRWLPDAASLQELTDAAAALRRDGAAAPLFVLIYAVAATVALPITPFTLASGAVFGFWTGLAVSAAGSLLGALGGYYAARLVGREAVDRLLGPRCRTLDRLGGSTSRAAHMRRRLIVVIPFALLNYAGGLARMRLRDFLPATALGTLPALAIYTYFAHALVAGAARAQRHAYRNLALASALLLLLSFTPLLLRRLGWRDQG